mmetsp:Transcript_2309/g.3300  ORF Transcript_2309/g.3300 Transcript_2309/m.3300 type:complete len:87 (+) Transcript_2309:1531-1791(+)
MQTKSAACIRSEDWRSNAQRMGIPLNFQRSKHFAKALQWPPSPSSANMCAMSETAKKGVVFAPLGAISPHMEVIINEKLGQKQQHF